MATKRKPAGKPTTWHTKIAAPAPALELYALIARLMRTPGVFDECHIYSGALLRGEPMIKFQGEVTRLPHVVASYLGLPSDRRRCETPGCCNPFHYLPGDMADNVLVTGQEKGVERPIPQTDPIGDWMELVDFELDKRGFRVGDVTLKQVRAWIPVEDMTDNQIAIALARLKEKEA